jgi:hypothetical protein
MTRLLHSAKFWMAVVDAAVSSLAIILAWFFRPDIVAQVLTLIGLWQPVVIVVIGAIAWEDGKEKGAPKTTIHNHPAPAPLMDLRGYEITYGANPSPTPPTDAG